MVAWSIGKYLATMHLTDDEVDRLSTKLAGFTEQKILDEILTDYATVLEEYRRVKNNWEEACISRDRYKREAKGHDKNPFALVLVDGDGYVFDESLIKGQYEGGATAAQRLHGAIKADLDKKGLEQCQVMVRVYANVAGLSKALASAGLLGHEARSLGKFIAGFNRQYGLVDFGDAGELKENADFKLRELLRLYGDSTQCKHIYFAGCHDVGYITALTPYMSESRCTLLRAGGTLFHPQFVKLGLSTRELPDVFRSLPLAGAKPPTKASGITGDSMTRMATAPKKQGTSEEEQSTKKICAYYPGSCKFGAKCTNLHIDGKSNANAVSWRAGGGTSREGDGFHPSLPSCTLPNKLDIPSGHIPVNSNAHRLDPRIAAVDKAAMTKLFQRGNSKRLCNHFHLLGRCDHGSNCEYDHTPLDTDLLPALELLARSLPCSQRGRCRLESCLSGHICQELNCRHYGGQKSCRLSHSAHVEPCEVADYVPAIRKLSQDRLQREVDLRSASGRSDGVSNDDTPSQEDEEVHQSGGISILSD
jgi:hypothetical protein